MFSFEPTSFFLIGYTFSEENGRALAAVMPDSFKKKGHFTVSAHPDKQGRYAVMWDCHKLEQSMPLMILPFEVISPRD